MKLKTIALAVLSLAASVQAGAQYAPVGDKIKTRWAGEIDVDNVWNEYPRPIMERADWVNLNGLWDYAILDKDGMPTSSIWVTGPSERLRREDFGKIAETMKQKCTLD